MFACVACGTKKVKEKDRVFRQVDWCRACVDAEGQRSYKEDYIGNYTCRRIPRYMIDPSQHVYHGYPQPPTDGSPIMTWPTK